MYPFLITETCESFVVFYWCYQLIIFSIFVNNVLTK